MGMKYVQELKEENESRSVMIQTSEDDRIGKKSQSTLAKELGDAMMTEFDAI